MAVCWSSDSKGLSVANESGQVLSENTDIMLRAAKVVVVDLRPAQFLPRRRVGLGFSISLKVRLRHLV